MTRRRRWRQRSTRSLADIDRVEAEIRRHDPRLRRLQAHRHRPAQRRSPTGSSPARCCWNTPWERSAASSGRSTPRVRSFILPRAEEDRDSGAPGLSGDEHGRARDGRARGQPAEDLSQVLLGPIWNARARARSTGWSSCPTASLQSSLSPLCPSPIPGRSWSVSRRLGKPLLEHSGGGLYPLRHHARRAAPGRGCKGAGRPANGPWSSPIRCSPRTTRVWRAGREVEGQQGNTPR